MNQYFIIGASSGIGEKLVENLVQSGHQVFGTYFKHEMTSQEASKDYHLPGGISTLKA